MVTLAAAVAAGEDLQAPDLADAVVEVAKAEAHVRETTAASPRVAALTDSLARSAMPTV